MNCNKRQSALSIMGRLVVLIKPLTGVMFLGILLGVSGNLCAIFISVLAGKAVSFAVLEAAGVILYSGWLGLLAALLGTAIMRGFFHYGEQYCNHYIAFRILAIIRHKVFAVLRKLCPAKLEGKDKGDIIAIITSDIELLEVFFAHTVSPIAIAVLVSVIMTVYIAKQNFVAGVIALIGYLLVGAVIPVWNEKRSAESGLEFRNSFGKLGSFVLSLMYGLDETLGFGTGEKSLKDIQDRSDHLAGIQKKLTDYEKSQKVITNLTIQIIDWIMIVVMAFAYIKGNSDFEQTLTAIFAMMGSFGPVVALASLSNNLNQTLACGERVLSLLDEDPEVVEVIEGEDLLYSKDKDVFTVDNISFSYGNASEVLTKFSLKIPRTGILGIHGESGCGKSTLLRLLMRFWDVDSGAILVVSGDSSVDIRSVKTSSLRNNESLVTQETWLFHDTISNNIAVAREGATADEIISAAKKASIHDFIMSLPDQYDTEVGELGDTLSGGEKQRIGLARAFLHDAPILILDEPTSALDSLNEGIILKSLREECVDKSVILVSHRESTMGVADSVIEM